MFRDLSIAIQDLAGALQFGRVDTVQVAQAKAKVDGVQAKASRIVNAAAQDET